MCYCKPSPGVPSSGPKEEGHMKTTKTAAFLARADKLLDAKEGPEFERVRIAIREGLLIPGRGERKERGGVLKGALHCMNLARIIVEGRGIEAEDGLEPEHVLAYLAEVAMLLECIIDAVHAELDQAEAENARRQRKLRKVA